MPMPLVRRWARAVTGTARPLGADGVPPSPEASRIFLVAGADPPADRPGDGPPPLVGRPGGRADLGRLPRRQGHRRHREPGRRARARRGRGRLAERPRRPRPRPAPPGPVRQGRARVAGARGPSVGSPARLPDRRRPRLLPVRRPRADGHRRRHGAGRLVVLPAGGGRAQPPPLDRPEAGRPPGPQAERDPRPGDGQRASARRVSRRPTRTAPGCATPCRSTMTAWRW